MEIIALITACCLAGIVGSVAIREAVKDDKQQEPSK